MRAEARGIIIHRVRRLFRNRIKPHYNLLVIFPSTEPRPSLSLLPSLTFYDLSDRKRRRGTKIGRTRTPGRNDNFRNLERKRIEESILYCFIFSGSIRSSCHKMPGQCNGRPCMHGGSCTEGWNRYVCDCSQTSFAGATCGDGELHTSLRGSFYLLYSHTNCLSCMLSEPYIFFSVCSRYRLIPFERIV